MLVRNLQASRLAFVLFLLNLFWLHRRWRLRSRTEADIAHRLPTVATHKSGCDEGVGANRIEHLRHR